VAPDLDGLLCVLQFFHDNPRPNHFARELPLPEPPSKKAVQFFHHPLDRDAPSPSG
jgi:hypothetical protein